MQQNYITPIKLLKQTRQPHSEGDNKISEQLQDQSLTTIKNQAYQKVRSPRSTLKPNLQNNQEDQSNTKYEDQEQQFQQNDVLTDKKEIINKINQNNFYNNNIDDDEGKCYIVSDNNKDLEFENKQNDDYANYYNNSNIMKSKNDLDQQNGTKEFEPINSINNELRLSQLKSDDIIHIEEEQNEQTEENKQQNAINQQLQFEEDIIKNNPHNKEIEQNQDQQINEIDKKYLNPGLISENQFSSNKDQDILINNQEQLDNIDSKENEQLYGEEEKIIKQNQNTKQKKKNQFEELKNGDLELIAFDIESEQHKQNQSYQSQLPQLNSEIKQKKLNSSNRNIQIDQEFNASNNKNQSNNHNQQDIIQKSENINNEQKSNSKQQHNFNEKKSVRFVQQTDEIEIDFTNQRFKSHSDDENTNEDIIQQPGKKESDQNIQTDLISKQKNNDNNNITNNSIEGNSKSILQAQTVNQKQKVNKIIFDSKYRTGISTISHKDRHNYINQTPGNEDNENKAINNSSVFSKSCNDNHAPIIQALVNELDKMNKHIDFKREIEQFIILFNKNPEEGIKYLMLNEIKQPHDIAHRLMTTQGLSKQKLGELFASPKPQNQQIMEEYCKLLNFKDLNIGDAIRYFLKSFKLPGEAQQIDRVITIFSNRYMEDNPQTFNDEDTPYIITYSAIMLNVDAHNPQIENKDRMSKKQFVDRTSQCCKGKVSAVYLEEIYDSIVKEKFETHESITEKVYARMVYSMLQGKAEKLIKHQKNLGSGYSGSDGSMSCTMQTSNIRYMNNQILALKSGSNFLKYGRKGEPHTRKVFLSEDERRICWQNYTVNNQTLQKLPSQKNNTTINQSQLKEKLNQEEQKQQEKTTQQQNVRYILVSDIVDIALGCTTTEVFRKNNVPPEFDQYCFSLIAKSRTLDLKTDDKQQMDYWVNYFYRYLVQKREDYSRELIKKRRNHQNKEKYGEIWRVDIFPKWEEHWDYNNHRPQNLYKMQEVKKKKKGGAGLLEGICSCFNKRANSQSAAGGTNPNISLQAYDHPSIIDSHKKYSESHYIGQEEFDIETKNKSLLLIMLWRAGIPDWVRKTLWPLAIGNRLEITESLYQKLRLQYKSIQNSQYQDFDVQRNQFLNQMESEIKNYFDNNGHLQKILINQNYFTLEKQEPLKNILSAFIIYRSDLGYVQQIMIYLGAILLQFLDEYFAFQCFVNIIYSYHFINLYKLREIEWRLQFFNDNFQKRFPLVYQHFNSLDLPTETFLVPWMLSLFSNSISDIDTLSRIWDNFFLEGELFLYKTALAIIEFFQLELKMSTIYEAVNLLKNVPQTLTEELLFDIIEDIKLPYEEFSKLLEKQYKSVVNNQIFQGLL